MIILLVSNDDLLNYNHEFNRENSKLERGVDKI